MREDIERLSVGVWYGRAGARFRASFGERPTRESRRSAFSAVAELAGAEAYREPPVIRCLRLAFYFFAPLRIYIDELVRDSAF